MPNPCRINWARRGPVHNSVSNPCSVGFSLNQRRTIFSWVGEIRGDGPRQGRRATPLRQIAGSGRTNTERIGGRHPGIQRPPRWSILRGCGERRGTFGVPVPQVSLGFSYNPVYETMAAADITFLTLYSRRGDVDGDRGADRARTTARSLSDALVVHGAES